MKKIVCIMMALAVMIFMVACGNEETVSMTESNLPTVQTEGAPETQVTVAETEAAVSPEELFSTVGTLKPDEISANKVLPYVHKLEDGKATTQEIDCSLLPPEWVANGPEEVRYIVDYKYIARKASSYIGDLQVFHTSIHVDILDVISKELVASETFYGEELPESITSTSSRYYGAYPDETEIKEWIIQTIQEILEKAVAERSAQALAYAQQTINNGAWSYNNLLWLLTESDQASFTTEEALYALENCEADWFAEALEFAMQYVEDYDRAEVETFLTRREFTPEQIAYALDNCG